MIFAMPVPQSPKSQVGTRSITKVLQGFQLLGLEIKPTLLESLLMLGELYVRDLRCFKCDGLGINTIDLGIGLDNEESGSNQQGGYNEEQEKLKQAYIEASGAKRPPPVAAQGDRVPEGSSAPTGVFTRAARLLTGHAYDSSAGYREADVTLLNKKYEDALNNAKNLWQKLNFVETTAKQSKRQWDFEQRRLISRINELESQVGKERSEKLQHQRRVDKIAAHIDKQEFFIGIQMSDSDILGMWQSLWVQVKGWSVAFSSNQPIDKKFLEGEPLVKILRTIAPGDPKLRLLDQRKTRRESVQAIVGYILAEEIFRRLSSDESFPEAGTYAPALDQWTPEHREAIDNLERSLSRATQSTITTRELHDWRAFTVSLLSRIDPAEKMQEQTRAAAGYYASQLMNMISAWAKPTETQEALESSVTVILQKALYCSMEIRKQRAYWSVELPCRSTEFNEDVMEDVDADADAETDAETGGRDHTAKIVELYLFPGLYKQGNADGEHFDVKRCFVKGKVKCTH
ncbi:hypothetical protein BGX38DRAFT_1262320 [Terfezia claveryi]|nr:hypothetical protein BGX38DRAFT_1262320 [Terfezia claveryi]